ncbi:MAG: hypothetical protein LBG65_02775 [Puniceicoccales bacterium]|jgi:hypothetical protein|nr:hypothetical protein [Puniceicoccales bacterium]
MALCRISPVMMGGERRPWILFFITGVSDLSCQERAGRFLCNCHGWIGGFCLPSTRCLRRFPGQLVREFMELPVIPDSFYANTKDGWEGFLELMKIMGMDVKNNLTFCIF